MSAVDYPAWVCATCGERHGRRPVGCATWHPDTCGICHEVDMVTEPRDFGHLKPSWIAAAKGGAAQ